MLKHGFENTQKIILVGDEKSGKTAISLRLTNKGFSNEYKTTIGVEFHTSILNHIKHEIWDTSGNERFKSILKPYFQDAKVAIICINAKDDDLELNVKKWYNYLLTVISSLTKIFLFATKMDQVGSEEKQYITENVNKIAKNYSMQCYFTSALKNEGIKESFAAIANLEKDEEIEVSTINVLDDEDEVLNKPTGFFAKLFCCCGHFKSKNNEKELSKLNDDNDFSITSYNKNK